MLLGEALALGCAMAWATSVILFKWADASVAAVLNQMATVFTPLLAWLVLREPLTRRRVLGIGVALIGVVAILVV